MKFCAIDIEADQPSNKVIQIGAIIYEIVGENFNVISKFNQFLDHGKEPNWDCKLRGDLTLGALLAPIREDYCEKKQPAAEVFNNFWQWTDTHTVKLYTQWGSGDLKAIIEQSGHKKNIRALNLKNTFLSAFAPIMGRKKPGLFSVCEKFNLKFEGDHHNAFWDAFNTAKIHFEMVRKILR